MDEPLLPRDGDDDDLTPLESPVLLGPGTKVVIRGDLALAIRDAVRQSRRYQYCDLRHPGPHFQWNDNQWTGFHDWAHDHDATFQVHAWVLAIDRIAEDPTSDTHQCRVYAALGRHSTAS